MGEQDRQFLRQLRLEFFVHRKLRHSVFEIGKRHHFDPLRTWFQALYETLLGSSQGPRMGSFIALYGLENTRRLVAEALAPRAA